jgi:hypothetical protein
MSEIQFSFGPRQQYVLKIPVAEENRANLLAQTQAAIAVLKKEQEKKTPCPQQQVFPFCK